MMYEIKIGIMKNKKQKKLVFNRDFGKELSNDEIETSVEELTSYLEEICGLNVMYIIFSENLLNKTDISLKNDVKVKKALKGLKKSNMILV